MSDDEYEEFQRELSGLFPEAALTDAEGKLWFERVRGFPFRGAVDAIKDHRIQSRGRRRPDLGAFLGLLRVAVRGSGEARTQAASFSAILRQQFNHAGIDCRGMTDAEVITEHYRRCWRKCSQSDGYRRGLHRQCYIALISEGCEQEHAEYLAASIYDVADVFA